MSNTFASITQKLNVINDSNLKILESHILKNLRGSKSLWISVPQLKQLLVGEVEGMIINQKYQSFPKCLP